MFNIFYLQTKAGTYIAREFGIKRILSTLNQAQSKIERNAMETFNDVIETLRFLNTVGSDDDLSVPPLALHSLIRFV